MVRHIVMFSAKHPEDLPTIHAALSRLRAIRDARRLEVAYNAKRDQLSNEVDIVAP